MDILRNITLFVNRFFLYYIIVYGFLLFLSALVGSLKFYITEKKKKFKNVIETDTYIPVSIIIPAHNEEVTIIESVESLLALDYPEYEIIVVDDGSSDSTLNKLINHCNLKPIKKAVRNKIKTKKVKNYYETNTKFKLIVVEKENGGKADALNAGINVSSYPYFLTIDADSILQRDSLSFMIKPVLQDSNVIAVGGVIKLSNELIIKNNKIVGRKLPSKPIEIFQCLEYDRTFLASRTVFDLYNGNLIISGAFGLFKKQFVIEINGYKVNTIGEDMELVMGLHDYAITNKIPYRIMYSPSAICYTQVPSTLKDFKRQRKRWQVGLFQSLNSHKNMLLNPKYGLIGTFSYLYYLVYELFAPLTETIGLIFIFVAFYVELINVKFMIMYILIYIIFCTTFTITTFLNRTYTEMYNLNLKDLIKIVVYSFLENIGFRQLANLYRLEAFINYRKHKLEWNKIKRKNI